MTRLSATSLRLIEQLSDRASLCNAIFSSWVLQPAEASVGVKELTAVAGLSVSEEHGTDEILTALSSMGLITKSGMRWTPTSGFERSLQELATAFAAIDHYRRQVHKDATEAQVVLTRPTLSVTLDAELTEAGWRTTNTEETSQAFTALVQRAERRVVIMTPFFDERGAEWLVELISQIRSGIEVTLVLRSLEDPARADYPRGYNKVRSRIIEQGVAVFNYSIPHQTGLGRETFHAKVILADRNIAYVGSTNLTAASREYSMEMGLMITGKAAQSVAMVVDAVVRIATRIA